METALPFEHILCWIILFCYSSSTVAKKGVCIIELYVATVFHRVYSYPAFPNKYYGSIFSKCIACLLRPFFDFAYSEAILRWMPCILPVDLYNALVFYAYDNVPGRCSQENKIYNNRKEYNA